MNKSLFLLVGSFFMLFVPLSGQDYSNSLGLRISPYYGVTFKHFLNSDRALEGILLTRRGGFSLTGLYEIHTTAFKTPRLKAFGGIGGHLNFYRNRSDSYWRWDNEYDNRGLVLNDDARMAIGVDMILGMEYTLIDLPFNLGVDWKPAVNLIGGYGASLNQFAISFRFILN